MRNDKMLNLDKPVYELCTQHPELAQIMAEMGFQDITKPGMLATAGRFMTIPKGAAMKKIPLETVVAALRERGYLIEGVKGNEQSN